MTTLMQPSFAAGELAPALHARVDLAKYHVGAATVRNWLVQAQGGVSNRPGTQYVDETRFSARTARLIPFSFNTEQTYMLEFGHQYIRVIKDGAHVLETAKAITGLSIASGTATVTIVGHGYSVNDDVFLTGLVGSTQLNGRRWLVASVPTADTFTLTVGSGISAWTSGGTAARYYTVATPYQESDLALLKFTQSADVMTIVHPLHAPRDLSRTGHASWSLTTITFAPAVSAPAGLAVTAEGSSLPVLTGLAATPVGADGSTANDRTYRYVVIAEAGDGARSPATAPVAVANDAPLSVTVYNTLTWNAAPSTVSRYLVYRLIDGDYQFVQDTVGATYDDVGASPDAEETTEPGEQYLYVVTAIAAETEEESLPSAEAGVFNRDLSDSIVNRLTWAAVSGAERYSVYKKRNGIFGYIGTTEALTFDDDNIEADLTTTPPKQRNPFSGSNDYPSVVEYHEQRKAFGGTLNQPQTFWLTQSANVKNMNVSSPTRDDDAITRTIAAKQVNEIRAFVSLRSLLVLTSGAEFVVSPGEGDFLTPSQASAKPQTYIGASHLPPIIAGSSVLFVDATGSWVMDLRYDFASDAYDTSERGVLSTHLFEGYELIEWAWAQRPYRIIWAVRDDGKLLGLTYLREHDVYAWHRHDTEGLFESIATVREGAEDAVYVIVQRTIGGVSRRYIERFASRLVAEDEVERSWFLDCALRYDGAAATTISGLWHLEGNTVSILADGHVLPTQTVTNGAITLDEAASVVLVGLPYMSDLETLNLDQPQTAGKAKHISRVTVRVEKARGLKVGPDVDHLTEIKERSRQPWGAPIEPFTGDEPINIAPTWDRKGRVFIRQEYPLPATVLAVIPEVTVGG